jgi:hypothetical protein
VVEFTNANGRPAGKTGGYCDTKIDKNTENSQNDKGRTNSGDREYDNGFYKLTDFNKTFKIAIRKTV